MKNVAAYMLANLGGQGGSVESCTAILGSVGCEVDSEKLGALCASLEGKDIIEVLATLLRPPRSPSPSPRRRRRTWVSTCSIKFLCAPALLLAAERLEIWRHWRLWSTRGLAARTPGVVVVPTWRRLRRERFCCD